ncbi:type III secretion system export apparatus subunit SctR [Pleionea sp. CnH1-48]|uniref:type III secretion system export apparatus subunit SctR n=1 Tax=Pleionea sp. CnH1-48 TaxID=2954494 RepID=UPI002096E214|nr:type III secretion system export apparatus subunit SctR [Pleionea sp. CnH1-48]MCO7226992.1 type III secretion system export apparatus subunit SctR [Pleionea sp. CnH1-48]
MESLPNPISLVVILSLFAMVPFIAVMTTSFVKLVVVMSLVRNALGIQQIPPNIALHGLAIILTMYIMAPVGFEIAELMETQEVQMDNFESIKSFSEKAVVPLQTFLSEHSSEAEKAFFHKTALSLWPEKHTQDLTTESMMILVPSFVVSELTSAFEIGFLLYLPFIAIDLIVSNILLALGMMMVSPMTISLPFKLLLFVLLDGWTKLIHGLVLSYQ